jgi:uncharacterized protein YlxP (DUF503 family)
MVVGVGKIDLRLHGCRSLKEKRKVVQSMIKRLQNRYHASVAEIGKNDVYQRAEIGFAVVANSSKLVNATLDKMIDTAEDLQLAEIVDSEIEIINL